MADQKTPRRKFGDGLHRIDIQDVPIESVRREEIAFIADDA
jgi:hypothetical protein